MTKKLTSAALKKRLRECTQDELIDLIQRLYGAVPEAADMINVEYGDADYAASLLDKAKKQVRDEFFPKRGLGRCSLSAAKSAIRAFGRVCKEPALLLDLQLYYVECGIEFTNTYGDIDERFYDSMEGMYCEVVHALAESGDEALIDRFRERLEAAIANTAMVGWDFQEGLAEAFSMLS